MVDYTRDVTVRTAFLEWVTVWRDPADDSVYCIVRIREGDAGDQYLVTSVNEEVAFSVVVDPSDRWRIIWQHTDGSIQTAASVNRGQNWSLL